MARKTQILPRRDRLLLASLLGLALLAAGSEPALRSVQQLLERQALLRLIWLEQVAGMHLALDGLRVEPGGRLRLEGLSLRAELAAGAPLLSADELELTWSLGDLLLGHREPERLEARGITLRLDGEAGELLLTRLGQHGLRRLLAPGAAPYSRSGGRLLPQLPDQLVLHDLRIIGSGKEQHVPLLLLLGHGAELSGVVEIAGAQDALPLFLRLRGSRLGDGWRLRAEASEQLHPLVLRRWLGRRVGLRALALGPRELSVEGLTLSVPEEQGTEIMARVAALSAVRHADPHAGWRIELSEPELRLESYPDGRHNLEDLQQLLSRLGLGSGSGDGPGSGWPEGANASLDLPEFDLSLRQGKLSLVRYHTSGKPDSLILRGLRANFAPAAGQVAFTAHWQPGPGRGRLVAEGHLERGGGFSLRLRPDALELAELGRGSSFDLRRGVASGDLLLVREGERLTLDGKLDLADLSFSSAILAAQPLSGVRARMELAMHLDPASATLQLDSLAATLGELELSAWGWLELQDALRYQLTIAMGPVPCRDIPGSLPRGMIPLLEGLQLEGHTTLRVQAAGDLLARMEPEIRLEGSAEGFRVLQDAGPDLASLERPFVHTVYPAPGQAVRISVDPAVAGFTSYEQVSTFLRRAVVSAEDTGFYRHRGVDLRQIQASLG
ncbi:MAG: hypothetical protein FJ125_11740, partial [Deltaproteobacteria bacterium]|nr:hypothetical protein [Deltaproteobacteria bacterium]